MREVVHLSPEDARAVPWKNGRGVTHELALWPEQASFERGDFDWRISTAVIDAPGAFSAFPDHERILVVTSGDGLALSHPGLAPRVRIRPLAPYRFDGAWPTHAELARGPVSDFNVLTRRGVLRADVEALVLGARRTRESAAAGHAFIHVLLGELTARVIGEDEPYHLDAEESLWLSDLSAEEEVELAGESPDCTILIVRLARLGPGAS